MVTTSTNVEAIEYNGFYIKVYEYIEVGNWVYIIYEKKGDKWKRKRAIQHFILESEAMSSAKKYIDKYLSK